MRDPDEFVNARVKDLVDSGGWRQANVLADVSAVKECNIDDASDVGRGQYQHIGMSTQQQTTTTSCTLHCSQLFCDTTVCMQKW